MVSRKLVVSGWKRARARFTRSSFEWRLLLQWLAVGVLLAGCAGGPRTSATAVSSAPSLVWPSPPEPARFAYVGSVRRPADLGLKFSPFTRLGHWVTGSEKGNEPLNKPFGIALDEHGNLCLTDTGANAVCYYDKTKQKWSRWLKVGHVRFASPVAVVKKEGVFFVADSARGSVIAFDEAGHLLFETAFQLERPSGLAILADQLFVADSQRHCIVVFDLRGSFSHQFGKRGKGDGEFNFPTHLSADTEGCLYVTDSMNSRVQILDGEGHFRGQVGSVGDSPGHFGRPKGASVDNLGHVYAIDALFDNVQVFDRGGRLLLNLGSSGSNPGEFWLPNGIAISRDNEIYVTDVFNHRVQIFRYVGPS